MGDLFWLFVDWSEYWLLSGRKLSKLEGVISFTVIDSMFCGLTATAITWILTCMCDKLKYFIQSPQTLLPYCKAFNGPRLTCCSHTDCLSFQSMKWSAVICKEYSKQCAAFSVKIYVDSQVFHGPIIYCNQVSSRFILGSGSWPSG